MKKTILLSVFLLSAFYKANATVYTVSNNNTLPGSAGQYTTVSAAISAASNGDTILIQPSPVAYAGFTINKSLTIIGSGYNPQTTNGLKTVISGATHIVFGDGSSNSKLIGIYLDPAGSGTKLVWGNTFAVSNYTIERCYFSGTEIRVTNGNNNFPQNVLIEDNFMSVSDLRLYNAGFATNPVTVRNNIFSGGGGIDGSESVNVIKNNLFICGANALHDFSNSIIENNIFFSCFPYNMGANVFNNNYVFGSSTLPFGTNTGSGNITSTNAVYSTFISCGSTLNFNTDLRPVTGSACLNGGTDGTDIGITGGASPYYLYPAPYPMTGEAKIPQVTEITIPVSSVPSGGTLNINVKARKRD